MSRVHLTMNVESDRTSAAPLIASTALPSTEAPADPLRIFLAELQKLEHRMEERLKQLEMEMHRSQDEAVQKAAKKVKWEKGVIFKKKGHQEQHEFNEKISECLEEAADEISRRPCTESALDKARQSIDEGLRLIA